MAALCRWRSEVDVLEREADVAIATEAARREVLLGLLLDADSASRIQAVLTLLEESRQRATFAELALEAVSAEFDGIFNTEGASIATVLGDIISLDDLVEGGLRPLAERKAHGKIVVDVAGSA